MSGWEIPVNSSKSQEIAQPLSYDIIITNLLSNLLHISRWANSSVFDHPKLIALIWINLEPSSLSSDQTSNIDHLERLLWPWPSYKSNMSELITKLMAINWLLASRCS